MFLTDTAEGPPLATSLARVTRILSQTDAIFLSFKTRAF